MSKEGANIIPKSRQIEALKSEIKRLEAIIAEYRERYGELDQARPRTIKVPLLGKIEIYPNK